ncbi:tetratricopeptide repeat protein [Pelagicoccus sp. SDUM812005]|uniref:tetratricopeptide repeat protein n=1 Tax=Pelagicoccus sp. SDUM812005 TaxID=3041257 RepID=UPI00280C9E21|nr:tetratricopeptide repeat protein [Pelagicoccus sp. SDUM812005]MDQ8182006.1 tetratricopeptide repeat protein [Pelagicoccus sp. SDUM812005]
MNPKILVSLALVTLSALLLSACGGSADVASLIEKADTQIQAGKLADAEILLKNALRADKKNPQALALVGEIYKQQGRVRDAYQVLSAVKQLNPSDARSLASLASIELIAGLRDEALADARKALELDPSLDEAPILLAELASSPAAAAQTKEWLATLPPTPSIHAAIGSLELKSGNAAAASQRFEQAIEMDPNSSMGYAGRFQILLSQNKQEEAMAAFAKAAEVADVRSGIRIRYVQYLQQTQGDTAAKAVLDEILAEAPDYLPALGLAAELAAKMEEPEESKKLVARALKLDPIDPTALRVNGTLLVLDQKIDEAIVQLEKALELYPDDVKANYQIALAYLAKRDLGKARSRLSRVVQRVPGHLEANALLSTIQVQEEDFSGAIITLEKFLKANPNSLQGYLLLAEVYNRKGDSEAAVAIYKKLEEAQPENPQLDYLSGLSYLQGRNRHGARSAFESALADNPLHLQSVEQLTALDMGERNFDAALARIEQTIAASPNTSVLYTIRAQILQSKGDLDAAKESFEKSIELDANNRTARTLYARLLRSQGDEKGALAQTQAILKSNPNDIGAMTTIASLHETAGKYAEAVELYEKMLTVDPNYLTALNNLAYLYSTQFDKPERAFELAQKAREQSPTSPYTADTLGWIVYKRGDYPWALSLLQDSYNKLKDNAEVAYHLGSAQYQLGHRDAASRLLTQASSDASDFEGKSKATELLAILDIDTKAYSKSAADKLESHISKNKSDAQALATLATLQLRNGDRSAAQKEFEKVLKLSPENAFAKVGLAEILSEDPANASRVYTMANDAKQYKSETLRAQALQGLSLAQQGKTDLAKKQLEAIDLKQLPARLSERVAALIKD